MKKTLFALVLLLLTAIIVACGSNNDAQENTNENTSESTNKELTYNQADLDISLYDTSENLVNISPNGKTMYAYFTGVT